MQFIDNIVAMQVGKDILTLVSDCIKEFGEEYANMRQSEWYRLIREYVSRRTMRYDISDNEPIYYSMAAEPSVS